MTSAAFAGGLFASVAAYAADVKPAVIYDLGGKFDKSFNEGVFNGAEKFKKETGVDFRDFEIQNDAQREQALRKFAKDGYRPIIVPSASPGRPRSTKVADEFPKTKFAIIDMVVDKPNVQSIVFKEQEGSFLVGVLAAKTSKTGKVGFVGGMDIPLIRTFACGYAQGVKYARTARPRSSPEHDRHDAARPGTTRSRAANSPSRRSTGAPTSSTPRPARTGHRRAAGGGGRRQARHRRRLQPELPLPRQGADLDAEARRRRRSTMPSRTPRTAPGSRASRCSASRRTASAMRVDDNNKALITAEMKAAVDKAKADIIVGHDQGPRLHVRQQVPGAERAHRRGRGSSRPERSRP